MRAMRVLVLGGTQFIGRAVVDELLGRHEVAVLNRGTKPLWDTRITQLRADRTDPAAMTAALTVGYDAIIDVSGTHPNHMTCHPGAGAASDAARYVFISSAGVYDRTRVEPPFREGDPATGDSIWGGYGEAKAECERLLRAAWGERLTILRPPYVYGPHNYEQREQFLWARMLALQPLFIPGDGDTRIQFCHVSDLARTVLAAVDGDLRPDTYNVAEPATYSFAEYIDILSEIVGAPAHTVLVRDQDVPARAYFPFRQADLTLNVQRLSSSLTHRFSPLSAGMQETYEWFTAFGTFDARPTAQEAIWRASHAPASP